MLALVCLVNSKFVGTYYITSHARNRSAGWKPIGTNTILNVGNRTIEPARGCVYVEAFTNCT
jgi:hypothetical protein